eukprot:gene3327-3814_t
MGHCTLVSCFLNVDEVKGGKYGVEITRKPVLLSQEPLQDNVLRLSSKYGQMYECVLPVKAKSESQASNESNKTVGNNVTVISILNNTFDGICMLYTQGWWTYKFCYRQNITQFHESENAIVQGNVVSLGVFESEKDWNGTDSKQDSDGKLYHLQTYTNGSLCDLTGQPRHTLVKFFCDESIEANSIVSVEEPASCVYTMIIRSKDLCNHPLFKQPEKPKPQEISCSPALTQVQYENYLKKEKEMLQKKEETRKLEEAKKKKDEVLKETTKKNPTKGVPEILEGLFKVGKIFDEFLSSGKKIVKKEDRNGQFMDGKEEILRGSKESSSGEEDASNVDIDAGSDIISKEKKQEKGKDEMQGKDLITEEDKLKSTNAKSGQLPSEDKINKGETLISSGERIIERQGKKRVVNPDSPEMKSFIDLQKKLKEIDEKAKFLKKKDHAIRDNLNEKYLKTRKKAQKQITAFEKLLKKLVENKDNAKNQKQANAVELLIQRVNKNIKMYKQKIAKFDKNMRVALDMSESNDERYEKIFGKVAERTKAILNRGNSKGTREELRETPMNAEAYDKSDDKVEEPFDESSQFEEDERPEGDDLSGEVLKLVQKRAKKKVAKIKQHEKSLQTDSEIGENDNTKEKEGLDQGTAKLKVRVSKLNSNDLKVLEEQEKSEELQGVNSDANKLRLSGKKIEKLIKEKLKKAGVEFGANVKIKIITNNAAQMANVGNDAESEIFSQNAAAQFKDMLVKFLGGRDEQLKEERRYTTLEDNYKFVYDQERDVERTEDQNDNFHHPVL